MTISTPPESQATAEQESDPSLKTEPAPVYLNPSKKFIFQHPAFFLAFGGGAGLSPAAPGTVGTLVAFPLFWLINQYLDPIQFLLLIDLMFIAGIWICSLTSKVLNTHDHGGIVWDEIVAFLLVLFFTPDNLVWQAFAFLFFRLFDIFKPQPIRYFDKKLRGGFGVMFDDMLAAFYTLLCLAAWKAFVLL